MSTKDLTGLAVSVAIVVVGVLVATWLKSQGFFDGAKA